METKIEQIEWWDDRFYKVTKEKETWYIPSVTTKLGIVAKPFLALWRGDIGNREADLRMNDASNRGIRIHNAWACLTTNGVVLYQPFGKPTYTPQEMDYYFSETGGNVAVLFKQEEMYQIHKLSRWLEIVRPEIIFSEKMVFDWGNKDSGTMDNLIYFSEPRSYMVNGKTPIEIERGCYVLDLKTGKEVDDTAHMQTAAYAQCCASMGDIRSEIGRRGNSDPLPCPQGTIILHTGSKNRGGIEGLATIVRTKDQMLTDYEDYRHASALWERKNKDASPKVFDIPSLITMRKEEIKPK